MNHATIDIAMDSSASPPTILIQGTALHLETDAEAHFVFDLLNDIRDQLSARGRKMSKVLKAIEELHDLVRE